MGAVFKKIVTKPLPSGAEIFTRKHERFARWKNAKGKSRLALLTVGKDGSDRIVLETKYYAKYRDGNGIVQTVPTGCRDETAARSVLGDLERRAELVKAKVMTPGQDAISGHQETPLAEHFDAFIECLKARDKSEVYRSYTRRYLDRVAAECSWATLADLRREALERWLATQVDNNMGAKARNHYRAAVVSFCNWCVATDRLLQNPFAGIPKANEKADRRRLRRAMTESELVRLLDVARRRPLLDTMTVRRGKRKGEAYAKLRQETIDRLEWLGHERALIYKTLVLTGLRKSEIASLNVGHVFLDGQVPYIALDAAAEKSRQGNEIALRDDLASDLNQLLTFRAQLGQLLANRRRRMGKQPVRLLSPQVVK